MAAQTDSFLIHGSLIAKDGGLGQHTGIINVPILQDDLEFLVQAVGVVLYPACAQSFHLADALFQKHKAAFHVCLHLGALVHIGVAGGQHIREAGQNGGGHIIFDPQLLG